MKLPCPHCGSENTPDRYDHGRVFCSPGCERKFTRTHKDKAGSYLALYRRVALIGRPSVKGVVLPSDFSLLAIPEAIKSVLQRVEVAVWSKSYLNPV